MPRSRNKKAAKPTSESTPKRRSPKPRRGQFGSWGKLENSHGLRNTRGRDLKHVPTRETSLKLDWEKNKSRGASKLFEDDQTGDLGKDENSTLWDTVPKRTPARPGRVHAEKKPAGEEAKLEGEILRGAVPLGIFGKGGLRNALKRGGSFRLQQR